MAKDITKTKTFEKALALAREGNLREALAMIRRRFAVERQAEAWRAVLAALNSQSQGGEPMSKQKRNNTTTVWLVLDPDQPRIVDERPEGARILPLTFAEAKAAAWAAKALADGVIMLAELGGDRMIVRFPNPKRVAEWRITDRAVTRVVRDEAGEMALRATPAQAQAIRKKAEWLMRLSARGEEQPVLAVPMARDGKLHQYVQRVLDGDLAAYWGRAVTKRAYREAVQAVGTEGARELVRLIRLYRGDELVRELRAVPSPRALEALQRLYAADRVEVVEEAAA